MRLEGQSALITGASQGLGRALAIGLAEAGVKVALVARQNGPLEEAVHDIRHSGGVAYGISADIGDKRAIYPVAGQAAALIGPISILINNASTLGPIPLTLLLDTDCEDLVSTLATNTLGPFRLMKAVLGSMMLRGEGVVVNISSDAAVVPYPKWGPYSASKAALDHLTRVWAEELSHGDGPRVRMFSVDPGEMNTKMHADAMPDADPAALAVPAVIAVKIISMIRRSDEIDNGARLVATEWEACYETS
jgi:NAD(P)-dependent dehydrogenase (short-subunit alcohol dehydrogenase family)